MKQSKSAAPANDGISFEQAIVELETIVSQMELGNLALDESFNAYKRGAELLKICQQSLNNVEQQVRVLTDAQKLASFEPSDEQ
ncbi:MAG: exodeoxyribonuclease VII small subunit [Pseudomonadota bacterium]